MTGSARHLVLNSAVNIPVMHQFQQPGAVPGKNIWGAWPLIIWRQITIEPITSNMWKS